MSLFELCSILITLAGLFSFISFKYLRLPTTIGVMVIALACSLLLIALGHLAPGTRQLAASTVARIDFQNTVLHVLLAFLLFAGSLHLDINHLKAQWAPISALALIGTAASTMLVGLMSHVVLAAIGLPTPWLYCFLFGALISPTDPIAVLSMLKDAGAAKDLETQVAGESLFNDGVGVVLFLSLLETAVGRIAPAWSQIGWYLFKQVAGGAAAGFAAGIFAYQLIKRVDNHHVEVLLTLALATGSFTWAEAMHVSAPIANVVAGLFIGNRGRSFGMSEETRRQLDLFWELIDEILNAVLFLLIGLQVLLMVFTARFLLAGVLAVGLTLLARWISVSGIVSAFRWRTFRPGTISVLTWGGLRGGLSMAMALSIPPFAQRDLIVSMTYCVVAFSVVAQGLSVRRIIRKCSREPIPPPRRRGING